MVMGYKKEKEKGKVGWSVLQTSDKPKEEGGGESRRSSTRHPGIVSIKYSDMLLIFVPTAVVFTVAATDGEL